MAEPATFQPVARRATKDRLDRRQVINRDSATTGRAGLVLVVAAMFMLTSGCSAHRGAGSHSNGAGGSGFRVAGDATTGTVSCDSLIGQPVKPRARCGDSGDSASAGCYESRKRHGDYYWMDTGTGKFLYGRPGSMWQVGAKPLSRGEMAKQLGCS